MNHGILDSSLLFCFCSSQSKVMRFENAPENHYVASYGVQDSIEIGGVVDLGMQERCIDRESGMLKEECWKLSVYFSQETAPRRIKTVEF